ncbi:hypothetical protein ABTN60_18740, partial [Acinetobacter baumannii]
MRMDASVKVLTPERWADIDKLFSEGAVTRRCWCMYWRIGARYRRQQPSINRAAFNKTVRKG